MSVKVNVARVLSLVPLYYVLFPLPWWQILMAAVSVIVYATLCEGTKP